MISHPADSNTPSWQSHTKLTVRYKVDSYSNKKRLLIFLTVIPVVEVSDIINSHIFLKFIHIGGCYIFFGNTYMTVTYIVDMLDSHKNG